MITDKSTTKLIEPGEVPTQPAPAPAPTPFTGDRFLALRTLAWLIVPVLAIVAFAPTLGTWFVSDDFGHLQFHQSLAFPKALFAFGGANVFYRPLSTILTWNLGYAIFGLNALPYHIFSLLFHALASYFLARGVAVIANDKRIGWLAGAVFAVYPLCTEPVAWLASQWDVQGAACVTGAVWAFGGAWRTGSKRAYALSLFAAFLAVGMKESTLPLPLLMPFVALVTELSGRAAGTARREVSAFGLRDWLAQVPRAVAWSLPFFIPTLLFVALRLFSGSLGGYSSPRTDIQDFFWAALAASFLEVLMPLNPDIFNGFFTQLVGLAISAFLAVGLVLCGRRRWHLLVLGLAWWIIFLGPVLNLQALSDNPLHYDSRLLYLSMMGFAIVVGTLVAGFLDELRDKRSRRAGWAVLGAILLGIIPITWTQLQPWVAASNQTRHVVDELSSLLPSVPRAWIDINVAHLPRDNDGAYVFRNGLDTSMIGFDNQLTRIHPVKAPEPQSLPAHLSGTNGRFDLDFSFRPTTELYYISTLSGVTSPIEPPANSTRLWDFRTCGTGLPRSLGTSNASTQCSGTDIVVSATTGDPAILLPDLNIDLAGKNWLRLGVSALYPQVNSPRLAQWFWQADGSNGWSEDKSRTYFLDTTQTSIVYWTYIRAADLGKRLDALRFDPVNDKLDARIAWISLDVK